MTDGAKKLYGSMWDVSNRGSMESLGLHVGRKGGDKIPKVELSVSNPELKMPRDASMRSMQISSKQDFFETEPSYIYQPNSNTRNVS